MYATVPSGSTPNAASPSPFALNTNSAPGANVVEVVVDDVVDVVDDVVDVGAAVVTGIVVLVVVAGAEVLVLSATEVDVEPLSELAELSSLQPATKIATKITGRRRVGFTGRSLARGPPIT
ncbi:MAG TPA: hypothetical protein VFE86_03780 [Ilumatobacteraceae bacterium]|nr:hypothetical protein [Ilumatobacteraceae bacterium]